MAQTSIGFDGTVDTIQWATLSRYLGSDYCVDAGTSLKGTAVGGVRTVSVAAGSAFGRGVLTALSVAENVALPTPAAGQWFLVVLRRVWATKVTSLVAIPHTTTSTAVPTIAPSTYPAARLTTPGVQDDQPLLWAWANATNTTLLLVDLREVTAAIPRRGNAAARDLLWGAPTTPADQRALQNRGATWLRTDTGGVEVYRGLYDFMEHPQGALVAGWYPQEGPSCTVTLAASQTLAGTAEVPISWNTEISDPFDMHPSGQPTRLVAPISGMYEIKCGAYLSPTATATSSYIHTRLVGAEVPGSRDRLGGNSGGTSLRSSSEVAMVAGDYVEIFAQSSVGGAVVGGGVTPSTAATTATLTYIRPL